MLEPLIIVEARSVVRLGKFQKLWMVGWVVATLALVATGVQSARLYEAHQRDQKLKALIVQVKDVQRDQEAVTASYVKAWENQQATSNLLITWGQYVKDRDDVVKMAKDGRPVNLMTQY